MVLDPMMAQQNPPQHNPLERYKILQELGRGAIGTVHAARDGSTGAVVALKILDPVLFSAKLAELFVKNARSAGRLRHRNIVKVHDAGEGGGTAYVAMELVEGESLRQMLDKGPLPIARAIQIFDDIASALAYAHEEGMVHRGVKPSNIMVLRSGMAKIGDFGTGQIGEAALRYMSPEQVRGDPVDHRSDLFSLGAVFYEMLTRRAPFEGKSPKETQENVLRAQPPRPSEVNPHVPAALDGIVFSMLAGEPDKRFANARILLRDLQRFEEGLGLGPGAGAGTAEPAAHVPQVRVEPRLRTPRDQTEPAAPQPATKREPTLGTLDPDRFRDPAPMQDAPRFGALDEHDARFMMDRDPGPERSSGSRATRFAALAIMVAVFFAVVLHYSSRPSEPLAAASRTPKAPATAAAPEATPLTTTAAAPSRTAAPPVAEAPKEPATKESVTPPAAPETAPRTTTAAAPSRSIAPPPVAEAPKEPEAASPRAMGDARAEDKLLGIASAPKPLPPKPPAAEPGPAAQTESLPARESQQPATTARTAPAQEAPRVAQESPRIASAPKPSPPKPVAAEPSPPAQTKNLLARKAEQPARAQPANISVPQPGGMAKLSLAVAPQGELFINDKHYGTTPPITSLDLEPGMHRIEIRSGSRKPFLTYMAVQAGEQRSIRHDFDAKPSRPPDRPRS